MVKEGIVLRAVSGEYTVQSNGRIIRCTLRGNLKKEFQYTTSASYARRVIRAKRPYTRDTVSVGDRVRFVEIGKDMGVIEEVLPRRSRLVRAGFRREEHTIVCNLDQLVIVFACAEPNPDVWKLDRFLIAAEAEGLDSLIVANKRDLVPEMAWHQPFAEFAAIGYRVLPTSAKTGEGVDCLRDALRDKVSAFVGPSGVGKSSLLNIIQPGLQLRTGDVGQVTHKGRHTTTASQLIPLHSGGWVADTPGLRQFELLELDRDALASCFVEFEPYLGECRFPDCCHEVEPGCAIKAAVERGEIGLRRYQSFLQMAAEMESGQK